MDCRHADYKGALDDGSAWLDPSCPYRMVRGGGNFRSDDPSVLRVVKRESRQVDKRYEDLGIRVARTLAP